MSTSSWFASRSENVASEVLWEDGERVCRQIHAAGSDGAGHEFAAVFPAAESPSHDSIKRLIHEYELREHLDSAWAVRPLELVRDEGQTLLVVEHPQAEPLSRIIGLPIEIGQFLRIAVGLSVALGRLHSRGLIHKDIKPSNLLVNSATGEVWLTGFGIASRLPRERQTPAPPEIIAGTLAYMSPEQTGRMNRSVDSRSDFYALGVTLYQMLTGVLPFDAADALEWVHCHIARLPVAPADRSAAPEPLSDIIMKLLAKNAEDRYQTAAGLEADLRRCLAEWQSHSRIDPFPLGTDDSSDRLLIPEKLYGREREVDTLLTAFDRVVAQGTAELVLVSGYSGVGKSSVVNELHKVLVPPRGLFASGKFDQYKRDVPYATLAEAFQKLVREILVKSEAEVDHWRRALMDALGPNGQLIVNLIPEVEFIIGKQPPVAELPQLEARGRFQLVFRRFLGAFARPEHPFALFLDDLQWLDTATLELLERLALDPDLRHVLLIGAYRDNEVNSSHPLTRTLTAIREAGAKTQEIVLEPLSLHDVERLVADALHCGPSSAGPLAQLVHGKTGGNPFFAIQFVISLFDEGLLRLDRGAESWSWDIDRIHARGYTDNVVDLLIEKLSGLPAQTQRALQYLACLGHLAEITMLSIILDASEEQVHLAMWPAVREVMIERLPGAYRFVHDRIQEAAYLLIPTDMRSAAHLRIGRLLVSHTPPEMQQEAIFEIVNQLNRALVLITSGDERERLAELNLIAGKRAKSSTAYVSALKFLITGVEILGDHVWESRRDLIFALELERAGCEFLTGGLVAADERLTALSDRAADTVERAALACLHIDVCTTLDQSGRAVAVTLEYLRHVGIVWSPHPTEQEARQEYERTWSLLKGRDIEDLIDLPVITDPELVGTLDVLERGLNPALFTDAKLLSLMICGLVNLSLEHGNTGASCNGYAWLAMVAGPNFGNYKAGFRFGRLGYNLAERPGLERFKAHTYLSFAVLIIPWSMHVRTGQELIHRAFQTAIAMGDLPTATSCGVDLFGNLFMAGHPLADVQREVERSLEFAQKAGFGLAVDLSGTQLALIRTLRGFTTTFGSFNDAQFDELQFERHSSNEEGRAIGSCWYWVRKLQARFFAGDYVTAVAASLNAQRLLWTSPAFLETAEAHFYGALSHAACCDAASPVQYSQHIEALTAHHSQLVEWAGNCPENFANRAALVGAEIARIEHRDLDAMHLYEEAIKSAHENNFPHNEALANELAARFYASLGFTKIADAYISDARYCYICWGADGKVKQLEERYPRLRDGRTAAASAVIGPIVGQLDVESVVKASQAISSEIVLPTLIEKLVRTTVENAGAERGLLILIRDGEPRIEAEATTGPSGIEVFVRQEPVAPTDLPQSALLYMIRTQQRVLVDDASADGVYSRDEYVRRKHSRSVLCLPVVKQKKLVGALYLENSLAPFVFTPDRVTVLELLASQAAISLENATLYSDLELQAGLLQRLPVSAWTLKPDGTPDFVNQVWLEYSGQTLNFVRSHPEAWMTAVHPEDREAASRAFRDGIRSGQGFAIETRSLRARDETYRWHLQQAVVLHDAEGKLLKFVGTTTDIDDQKRGEGALRESEQSFRLILDGIAGLVAIMSPTGETEAVNRQTLDYFGRTSEQLKGWSTGDAVHPDDLPGVYAAWMNSVETASVYDVDHRLRRADGAYRWFHARGLPLCDFEGHVLRWYVLLTDIDDRVRAEEALRQAQSDLARINRVTTMGELAASLAHEVNQPIGGVLINANVCLRKLGHDNPDVDEARAAVTRIQRDAQRAADVIGKIHSQFEKAAPNREVLDVNEIIRETAGLLRSEAVRYDISVRTELSADLPQVVGDRVQLQQVAMNLLVNSIEAMKDVDGKREMAIQSQRAENEHILVTVSDTGIGFPPKLAEQIFDPFFTTKSHGTGMGLRISRSIIEAHGGRLWATANDGHGAKFAFSIPCGHSTDSG
jgi:PAS domain S-box-containing protein